MVREHRGRGEGRRHATRLPDEGDRRCRRVPSLRTARWRDLVAGRRRPLQMAPHQARVHPGHDEQGACIAEPRLLPHAAALVHRARDRHRGPHARLRSCRDSTAELRPARGHAIRDAERLCLRLGRLPPRDGYGARAGRVPIASTSGAQRLPRAASCSASASAPRSTRERTTSASRS